jgi:predicted ribosome quality control (RQC) complex YloA/Tae2 family protein
MEPKRELTSVDLRALVGELSAYEGAKVDKVYLYGENLLRVKMRDFDRGRLELLVEVGDPKRVHLSDPDRVPPAPERPPDFAKMLRNRVGSAEFAGVEQYGFDRVLQFHFHRPDGDTTVVAELFGEGNVAVLDGNREVVDCLETVRLKSRSVVPGSRYEFPGTRLNPLSLSYEAFVARMTDSDTDLVRTLATQLNFGGLYAEELCTRAGVSKTLDIADADDDHYRALYDVVGRLATDLREGALDPRIYYRGRSDGPDQVVDATPFPLEERTDLPTEEFETFDEALDRYFADLESEAQESESDRPEFEAEIAKRERIIEQQENAIENFERRAGEKREQAESLYENYRRVDEILSTVRNARENDTTWPEIRERFEEGRERGIDAAEAVVDVDESEGTVTVALDDHRVELEPRKSVEHNADRLYGEAKRIERKREGALSAVEDTREELEDLKRRREAWEPGDRDGETENEDEKDTEEIDWLAEPSIPVRKDDRWYDRFRWFHTTEGFLVLGGRNADQNEELVEKYLEVGDLFFHTQAAGGPATVLKAAGPGESGRGVEIPDRSRKEAARFAVSYSSVWKSGAFAGDVYAVGHDQVSKTPESGEYLEKGGFAVRGDRTYHEDVPVGAAVGIQCEPSTRVIGGPPEPITGRAETWMELEPGRFAQADAAKRIYRRFRERFTDTPFVRKVASPDRIQQFMPPGGSRILEE